MNASIRGPFIPQWSRECWLDQITNKLQGKVKAEHHSELRRDADSFPPRLEAQADEDSASSTTYAKYALGTRQGRNHAHHATLQVL